MTAPFGNGPLTDERLAEIRETLSGAVELRAGAAVAYELYDEVDRLRAVERELRAEKADAVRLLLASEEENRKLSHQLRHELAWRPIAISTTPPTEPGWYFARPSTDDEWEPVWLTSVFPGSVFQGESGKNDRFPVSYYEHWGPRLVPPTGVDDV